MIVESNDFMQDYRTSPVESGDVIISQNHGKGFVIATFEGRAWIRYETGKFVVSLIDALVKSPVAKVIH